MQELLMIIKRTNKEPLNINSDFFSNSSVLTVAKFQTSVMFFQSIHFLKMICDYFILTIQFYFKIHSLRTSMTSMILVKSL